MKLCAGAPGDQSGKGAGGMSRPKVFRPDPNDTTRPKRGLPEDDLASRETVFRDDLLSGQRILMTGGGSGMGKAAAFLAVRLGASVAICGRGEEKLNTTKDAMYDADEQEMPTQLTNISAPDEEDDSFDPVNKRYV